MQRVLSTVVLLGLLLATAAAFVITEHLKLIKSPMYATHVTRVFSPVCHCATDTAHIGFSLRRADTVTLAIVNSGDVVVQTVASGVIEQKGAVTFDWNGRTSAGARAPDGVYQPRVDLANARRTILMPNKITVDTVVPKVLSASDGDGTLTPGDHRSIVITYTLSEKAHVAVYLGSRRFIVGRPIRQHDEIAWTGKIGGKALAPGRHVFTIGAVDRAGNETPPAERKQVIVRIHTITLGETLVHVAAGARFTVDVKTGAPQYTWTFAGAHGTGKKKTLRLHGPAHRGHYRLVVSEHGDSATAVVIVGKK